MRTHKVLKRIFFFSAFVLMLFFSCEPEKELTATGTLNIDIDVTKWGILRDDNSVLIIKNNDNNDTIKEVSVTEGKAKGSLSLTAGTYNIDFLYSSQKATEKLGSVSVDLSENQAVLITDSDLNSSLRTVLILCSENGTIEYSSPTNHSPINNNSMLRVNYEKTNVKINSNTNTIEVKDMGNGNEFSLVVKAKDGYKFKEWKIDDGNGKVAKLTLSKQFIVRNDTKISCFFVPQETLFEPEIKVENNYVTISNREPDENAKIYYVMYKATGEKQDPKKGAQYTKPILITNEAEDYIIRAVIKKNNEWSDIAEYESKAILDGMIDIKGESEYVEGEGNYNNSSITVKFVSSSSNFKYTDYSYSWSYNNASELSQSTVSPEKASVKVTKNGTVALSVYVSNGERIREFSIQYTALEHIFEPTINVADNRITLQAHNSNVSMYYTIDGTDPRTNGNLYQNSVDISSISTDLTIKAVCKKDNRWSGLTEYTSNGIFGDLIINGLSEYVEGEGNYNNSAITVGFILSSSSFNYSSCSFVWTSDNASELSQSSVSPEKASVKVTKSGTVTLNVNVSNGERIRGFSTQYTALEHIFEPTINVADNRIILQPYNSNVSMYYTIDGTDPRTNGILYQNSVDISSVSTDLTIKAVCKKDNRWSELTEHTSYGIFGGLIINGTSEYVEGEGNYNNSAITVEFILSSSSFNYSSCSFVWTSDNDSELSQSSVSPEEVSVKVTKSGTVTLNVNVSNGERVGSFSAQYTALEHIFEPTINVADNKISLQARNSNVSMYYTIDGTDPRTNGILYQNSVDISSISTDLTIKAVCKKDNRWSELAGYTTYGIFGGLIINGSSEYVEGEGNYNNSAITVGFILYSSSFNYSSCSFVWTSDNDSELSQSSVSPEKASVKVTKSGTVILNVYVSNGERIRGFSTQYTALEHIFEPTINVADNRITLQAHNSNVSMYYTIDGTDPRTNGILYQNSVDISSISTDLTIKAVCKKDNRWSELAEYTTYGIFGSLTISGSSEYIEGKGNYNNSAITVEFILSSSSFNYSSCSFVWTSDNDSELSQSAVSPEEVSVKVTKSGTVTLNVNVSNGERSKLFSTSYTPSEHKWRITFKGESNSSVNYSYVMVPDGTKISVSGTSILIPNIATVTVTTDIGYSFLSWYLGSTELSNGNSATVLQDITISHKLNKKTLVASPTFSADPDVWFKDSMTLYLYSSVNCPIYYSVDYGSYKLYSPSNPIVLTSSSHIRCYVEDSTRYSDFSNADFTKDYTTLGSSTLVTSGVYKYSNLSYASSYANKFNLYLPTKEPSSTDRKPAVIYVHGGSWNSGEPEEYERYFETGSEKYAESYVTRYGLPVVSISYHHLGAASNKLEVYADYRATAMGIPLKSGDFSSSLDYYFFRDNGWRITDAVEDLETCVSYIKKHAQVLGIDPSFIVLDGYSAGANIILIYALDNTYTKAMPIKALIDRCGPADMCSYEYVRFFSDILTHGNFECDYDLDNWFDPTVHIDMKGGPNDGEKFLPSMIKAATGLDMDFSTIKATASSGVMNAPNQIKKISPAYLATTASNVPYIVMAYGNDVALEIKKINSDYTPVIQLKGDPLAPRKGGELLAKNLDTKGILSLDSNGRIVKNSGSTAYYKGDYTKGQMFTFIGSSVGGHDICSKNSDQSISLHWTASELELLRNSVRYAIETVCGISPR